MVSEKKKFDGSVVRIAEAVAGDSTGVVTIIIRNGKLSAHNICLSVKLSSK